MPRAAARHAPLRPGRAPAVADRRRPGPSPTSGGRPASSSRPATRRPCARAAPGRVPAPRIGHGRGPRGASSACAPSGSSCASIARAVAARFGGDVALRLDQALGRAFEAVTPLVHDRRAQRERTFEGPVKALEGILETAESLVGELAAELLRARRGALELVLVLEPSDLPPALDPPDPRAAQRERPAPVDHARAEGRRRAPGLRHRAGARVRGAHGTPALAPDRRVGRGGRGRRGPRPGHGGARGRPARAAR